MPTSPSAAPAPPRETFVLRVVRRRDLVRLRRSGPPPGVPLPVTHTDGRDPRYPSPRALRELLGALLEFAVHVGLAVAAAVAVQRTPAATPTAVTLTLIGGFLVVSFADRVLAQRLFAASLGKALLGLRVIRFDTGGGPTLWPLLKQWLFGFAVVFSLFG
ncbi:RDD family protein [Amycolatopsis sp. Hca4]|uniref:RDD family protein n=1 Tax=Amycolatopsis sp. Hca4 TaxID=2742131 RepID=UPI00158FF55E|nr:RDD family protein [Amycolatopsis sp. Hca4]QKV75841.1 RDD family protein [Amycolatopsis sp. Hca4]